MKTCPVCGGSGKFNGHSCAFCAGLGCYSDEYKAYEARLKREKEQREKPEGIQLVIPESENK